MKLKELVCYQVLVARIVIKDSDLKIPRCTGHEFGHNWGSSHDSDTSEKCAPKNNKYMMYPAAVDGSQPNNYYFSPCSKMAINEVSGSLSHFTALFSRELRHKIFMHSPSCSFPVD